MLDLAVYGIFNINFKPDLSLATNQTLDKIIRGDELTEDELNTIYVKDKVKPAKSRKSMHEDNESTDDIVFCHGRSHLYFVNYS